MVEVEDDFGAHSFHDRATRRHDVCKQKQQQLDMKRFEKFSRHEEPPHCDKIT